jgi:hypothetical protein
MFRQDFTCPALLVSSSSQHLYGAITHYCSPFKRFQLDLKKHWPDPRSLATTNGVSFDVLSSGYLDVSVPRVRLKPLFYSGFNTFL